MRTNFKRRASRYARLLTAASLVATLAAPPVRVASADSVRGRDAIAGCQTYLTFIQAPTGPTNATTGAVTVEFGEQFVNNCRRQDGVDPSTFQFTVNGVDRTSYFTVAMYGVGVYRATAAAVPLVAGTTNSLVASSEGYDVDANPRTDSDSRSVVVNAAGVQVTAASAPAEAIIRSTRKFGFRVKNTGSGSASFSLSCSVTNAGSCGTVSPSSVTLAAAADSLVAVEVSFSATPGSGAVTLSVSGPANASASQSFTSTPISVAYTNGDRQARWLCPTFGAGVGSAVQCGDLLYAHAFPGYRTLNELRSLTLLYNSATARPTPVIAVDYTLPVGSRSDRLKLEVVKANGTSIGQAFYVVPDSTDTTTVRRITLPIDAATASMGTGVHDVRVRVSRRTAGAGRQRPIRSVLSSSWSTGAPASSAPAGGRPGSSVCIRGSLAAEPCSSWPMARRSTSVRARAGASCRRPANIRRWLPSRTDDSSVSRPTRA